MEEIVRGLWMVRRDIVSDGYDAALAALAAQVPMRIHEYPAGTECFTWIVPEKWTCHEAWLETLDGRRLFSYDDHPLHVVSYSLPFDGVVTRDELMRHLHVHRSPAGCDSVHVQVLRTRLGAVLQPAAARQPARRAVSRPHPDVVQLRHAEGRRGDRAGHDATRRSCSRRICVIPAWRRTISAGVAVGIGVMRALLRDRGGADGSRRGATPTGC